MKKLALALVVTQLLAMPLAVQAQTEAPTAPAKAAPSAAALQEAKTYYAAGAAAYERSEFEAAIQAFLEAQKRAERPAVLFAIAQAFRRQYYVDKNPVNLQHALDYYRRYLAADPRGARAGDASQALNDLGPAEERLLADPNRVTTRDMAVQSDRRTRIAISASAAEGAEVSLDGAAFAPATLVREVKPGKHGVRVQAKGYFDETREIVAVEGSLAAFDITLRDKPATLIVQGESGARVEIDGRLVSGGSSQRFTVQPGAHLVAVSRAGHEPFVRELQFARGENKTVQVSLHTTSRRRISNGFLVAGGVSLIGAGVLGLVAFERDGAASDIRDARATRNISTTERDDYESARSGRNTFAAAAGIGAGAAVILGGLGLALHVFDDPARNAPTIDSDAHPEAPKKEKVNTIELGFSPWTSPHGGGGSVMGRF